MDDQKPNPSPRAEKTMSKLKNAITWVKNRLAEPSTKSGIGLALTIASTVMPQYTIPLNLISLVLVGQLIVKKDVGSPDAITLSRAEKE
jgi:hypothetical protein